MIMMMAVILVVSPVDGFVAVVKSYHLPPPPQRQWDNLVPYVMAFLKRQPHKKNFRRTVE